MNYLNIIQYVEINVDRKFFEKTKYLVIILTTYSVKISNELTNLSLTLDRI